MSKKYFTNKSVFTTGIVAVAFSFTLGYGQVYADNNEDEMLTESVVEENLQDQTVEETTDLTNSEVDFSGSKDGSQAEEIVEQETNTDELQSEIILEQNSNDSSSTIIEDEGDEPSLLPGDFFYFVKKLKENVQLALTFDEVKEAELLSAFAEERIKEAEALLANGEESLANDVLQSALEQQELALAKYEEVESEIETITEEATGDVENNEEEQLLTDSDRAELEVKISANLIALQAVLDKVDNIKAKEALAKNIAKVQEKLDKKGSKKLDKLEEKERKAANKRTDIEAKLKSGKIEEEEYNKELSEINKELEAERTEIIKEINKETGKFVESQIHKVKEKENSTNIERVEGKNKPVENQRENLQTSVKANSKEQGKQFEESEEGEKSQEVEKQKEKAAKKANELQREQQKKQEEAKKVTEAQLEQQKKQQEALKKQNERQREEAKNKGQEKQEKQIERQKQRDEGKEDGTEGKY